VSSELIEETGGAPANSAQIDAFDGFVVNNLTGLNINDRPTSSVVNPRWCSVTNARHTAQHTFTGTDNNAHPSSPVINLQAGPK
jgi:hypothetical protein